MFFHGKNNILLYNSLCGHLAQLGEHLLDVEGVRGSSPLVSTIIPVKSGLNSCFFCIRGKL